MQKFPVTVVMRSYNDAPLLPRTLASLDAQKGVEIKLFVFESASTDGSPAIFEAHGYDRITHLPPGTYHSSTVLNQGAEWAETEFIAFVNSDAILLQDDVLLRLAQALDESPRVAGAFARQLPRPDASPLTRLDYYAAFDHREELGETHDYLSLVTSMIRRSAWLENPFDPSLTYAEDYVWSDRAKKAGWALRYVKEAEVEHSHNYTPREMYRRSYGDAAALAILAEKAPPSDPVRGVVLPCAKRLVKDVLRLSRMAGPPNLRGLVELPRYRFLAQLGHWRGTRDALQASRKNPGGKQPTVPRA